MLKFQISSFQFRFSSNPLLTEKYSCNVVVKHENHQHDQNEDSGLLGDFPNPDAHRSADDQLDKEK